MTAGLNNGEGLVKSNLLRTSWSVAGLADSELAGGDNMPLSGEHV